MPRPKFEVSFFNDDKLAYVPSSGLYDFIETFTKWAPKKLTNVSYSESLTWKKSARDHAIVEAFNLLEPSVLLEHRKMLGIDERLENLSKPEVVAKPVVINEQNPEVTGFEKGEKGEKKKRVEKLD